MSEEYTTIKLKMPLIDDIELQNIDTFYNDIVSEYSKAILKEKEQIISQRIMMNLQQENKQLKEVIEEVREYVDNIVPCIHDEELLDELLQILDKATKEGVYNGRKSN